MSLDLCVLLWAKPHAAAALVEYEDRVLELLADHGACTLQRARTDGTDGTDGAPLEVQILRFPSQVALDDYMADERRTALAELRGAAIARTEVIPITLV
ncbi:MAG TPA: hypothetical protein VGL57_11300 [Solirubrobacteraceae bacterium]|jgi:uncharacterized protein (DUF1330 family)